MRILLLLCLLPAVFSQLPGQTELRQDTIQLPFKVSQNSDQLLSIDFNEKDIFSNSKRVELIQIQQLMLNDGDLTVEYEVKKLRPGFFYNIQFNLLSEEGNPLFFKANKIKGPQGRLSPEMGVQQQLIWQDVTEDALLYNRNYQLEIANTLWGKGLDCDNKPSLGFKEQWPYWLAGLIGAGLIGIGEANKGDAEDIYAVYEDLWLSGRTKADGVREYAIFDQKQQTHKDFTTVGIIVLAVDGLLYALRIRNHRKKVSRYNQYCRKLQGISLNLEYDRTFGNTTIGLRLATPF